MQEEAAHGIVFQSQLTLQRQKLTCSMYKYLPISEAAASEAWVCGCSLAGITGSNPAGDMDVLL